MCVVTLVVSRRPRLAGSAGSGSSASHPQGRDHVLSVAETFVASCAGRKFGVGGVRRTGTSSAGAALASTLAALLACAPLPGARGAATGTAPASEPGAVSDTD